METETPDSNIQGNISILLEEYPFLKVFSKQVNFDIFSDKNFNILIKLSRILFRINFDKKNKAVSVTPYIVTPFNSDKQPGNVEDSKTIYNENRKMIEDYIKYQLLNSGILDVLSDIPIIKSRTEETGYPPFDSCICVQLNPRREPITLTNYHNDSTLFQILQYNRPNSTYVLSSELLFYHENDLTVIHRGIENTAEGLREFPEEKVGKLIHDRYELAKTIYNEIKSKKPTEAKAEAGEAGAEAAGAAGAAEAPPAPPAEAAQEPIAHLRFKLKNGDTMVFPDTLWKHAVINPEEKREGNILHIDIANVNREDERKGVKLCSERIPTDQTQYNGRSTIGLFCFINNNRYMKPENLLTPFLLTDPMLQPNPVPIIKLTKEGCKSFLTPFSDGTGCMVLNGVSIKSRGGKNRKKRVKRTKKTRKSRRRKTIKN